MKQAWDFLGRASLSVLSLILFTVIGISAAHAQEITFDDVNNENGFQLLNSRSDGLKISFSVKNFSMYEEAINGEYLKTINLPGCMLQNDEGAPNLPGDGRYIAIPEGATVDFRITSSEKVVYHNIDVAPAPVLPLITDEPPLVYQKNQDIYSKDAYYPEQIVKTSEITEIRGVDAVILGVSPFQYNPVSKTLIVYKNIEIELSFRGGSGYFGEDRYRSKWWDPMLADIFINATSLPEVDYQENLRSNSRDQDFEYVIITPDNASFVFWADSLKKWRCEQGIRTGVFKLSDIGGNSSGAIEGFINDAYNNWNIPPSAVLLLADYGNSGDNVITSPIWNNYCVSDNIYADVDGNDLPEVALARITAQNSGELETMIGKMMDYEVLPPSDPDFYDHPVSSGGWQSDRWFILCADICYGFWENGLNKNPIREYAGYSGGAPSSWSTNSNTSQVVNYFGPSGLNYIPSTPSHLTDWGGNATRINADLNAGAFMILHRDHGATSGWESPHYYTSNLSGLNENPLSFVFSLNCLTGKYNMSSDCFAESFHKNSYGALGIIAASETSYSFVNDTYCWGMWDDMWPQFDPNYGSPAGNSHWIRPCFSNVSGKYYLSSSNWPSNPNNKVHTYHLFHHHGDAFLYVHDEVPQALTVSHDEVIPPSSTSFTVQATSGSLIGLSKDGNFIGSAISSGGPTNITIPAMDPGDVLKIIVSKQNHYRYVGYAYVAGAPGHAASPEPENHEPNVVPFTNIHWNKGNGGVPDFYKVYFGTDNPPTNMVNGEQTTDTLFVITQDLSYETQYFWRIDSYNDYGSSTGTVWDFTVSAPPDEDFESGDFASNPWYFDGNQDWVIDNTTTRHGLYSAKSGDINVGESSSLLIELEAESFFTVPIIFWMKTSTYEENKLQMVIDGNVVGEFSGETDWVKKTFFVSAGLHTFEWKYVKNAASGTDQDCVWIDYVKFPPSSQTMTANAGPDGETCEADPYQLNGVAENYNTSEWSTNGDGEFDDIYKLDAIYTPGSNDVSGGEVSLTLSVANGEDEVIDDMLLNIFPQALVSCGPDAEVCSGDTYTSSTALANNCQSLLWTTDGDGTFDNDTLLICNYTPGSGDLENGSVTLMLAATAFGPCPDVNDDITLTFINIPEAPQMPTGPDVVDLYYNDMSDYTIEEVLGAEYYVWELNPQEAGNIQGSSSNATVYWDETFLGQAFINAKAANLCGESMASENLEVTVYNTVGIENHEIGVSIMPNPNTGHFRLHINTNNSGKVKIIILNTLNQKVFAKDNIFVENSYTTDIDLSNYNKGLYILCIENESSSYFSKIIIK